MKSITFHPKALAFIRGQSTAIRREIGEALRDVQKGIRLGLPLSRPMPAVASGAHELRKKTQKTPTYEIAVGQQRLWDVVQAMSKTHKSVTVRIAEQLGRALGLSAADTAEMEFSSDLTVALAELFKQEGLPMSKLRRAPARREHE